jgi:hypothetical protein
MDTFAMATEQNIAREITDSFIASPDLGQAAATDLSRVEARASWSPRACVAFSTLSLVIDLKEKLSRIVRWAIDKARINSL